MKEGKYIYCLIRLDREPEAFASPGMGGAKVFTIPFQDIGAVVTNSPVIRYPVSRENTLIHEKVIEEVMEGYTVLPVRFATIAEDEEKIKKILEKEYSKFTDLLKKMKGKKELGLKAIFKEDVIYNELVKKYEDIRLAKEKLVKLPPEKTYYQRVQIGKRIEEALNKEREIYRKDIINVLSSLALEVKHNDTYGEMMVLNSAFLVEEKREAEFDKKIQELDERYGPKIKFKYVGKVPPFNFVNLVIETGKY